MPSARRLALPALLALLAGVLACSESTQPPATGLVRGQVTRIYSGQLIADARVTVDDLAATTDAQGRFLFQQVEQGETTIHITADTYRDFTHEVTVGEYQSLSLELTPVDTLVAISGRVAHRIDGPQRVRLVHDHGSVWTDGDGRWSLAEAPIGPLALSVDHPPYNHFSTEVLVHSTGQEFLQTLTRDTTVTWWVDDDAYVFTRDDSLNANRGSRPQLLVTADLGRTAMFSLVPPALGYNWAELMEARLDLHGHRGLIGEGDIGETRDLTVTLIGLGSSFAEGAVDFYHRPGFYPQETMTVAFAAGPPNQPLVIDLLPVINGTPASFWDTGLAIGASVDQAAVVLLSNDHGVTVPEVLDRPQVTYRLRI